MALSKKQAMEANWFHLGECRLILGPPRKMYQRFYQRVRETKVWITRPDDFELVVTSGNFSYSIIDQEDAEDWHTEEDCDPVWYDTEQEMFDAIHGD